MQRSTWFLILKLNSGFAYRFDDGTTVCDFASAGNLYDMRNRLCLWMPRK